MSLHFDFSGLNFGDLEARAEAVAPGAALIAAEYVKGVSQALAPVETGNLAGSAEARPSAAGGAEVYYPGPYARYQHYGPHWDPWVLHHEHGQGLYLETPMITEAPRVFQMFADALRNAGLG